MHETSNELPPCNQEIFDHGVSVGMFDIPKHTAEHICQAFSQTLGVRVDWHYIGGRVHIKALLPKTEQVEGAKNVGN
jgi:hypothetical protein